MTWGGFRSTVRQRGQRTKIRVFSPLFPWARSKWIRVSERIKSHLQRAEKTLLLFSVWEVTLQSKCSASRWPWEVRTMNVRVDFTLCNSADCCAHQHTRVASQKPVYAHTFRRLRLCSITTKVRQLHFIVCQEWLYLWKWWETDSFDVRDEWKRILVSLKIGREGKGRH